MILSPEIARNGYLALFDERTRAAHTATLLFARATEPSRWPTVPMVRRFARLFEVPAVELGAWFGLMCRTVRGEELWVDVFRNGPGTADAQRLVTPRQRRAYAMMLALVEHP